MHNGGTLEAKELSLTQYGSATDGLSNIYIGGESTKASAATAAGFLNVDKISFAKDVKANLVLNHTDENYVFSASLDNQGEKKDSHQLQQVAGTTILTGNSGKFGGHTAVTGGTLIVQDKLGGSAEVTGGTLQYGNDATGAANTVQEDLNVRGRNSTLSVKKSASLDVDGTLTLEGSSLALETGASNAILSAGAMQISNDAVLKIDATQIDDNRKELIRTTTGIQGDFASIVVSNYKQGANDFETLNTRLSEDGKTYQTYKGLSWTANNNLAHGTYTVKDGVFYTENNDLKDEKANLNWDGKTLTKAGNGTLVLSGNNSYSGNTIVQGGTVSVSSDNNLGAAGSSVVLNGGRLSSTASFASARQVVLNRTGYIDVANGTVLGLSGTLSGAGDLLKTGQGTLQLTNTANDYRNTLVQEGTLEATVASLSGSIGNAGTVVLNEAADINFAGHVLALDQQAGQMLKQGQGTLTLTGRSVLDWHIQAGQVSSAAERFSGNATIDAGASLALNQMSDAQYAGQLMGAGALKKQGEGSLLLTGDSSAFTGNINVEAGKLVVNGKLGGSQTVGDGAYLRGSGRLGNGSGSALTVAQGGTLSPGNSIGALLVDGDLILQAGSRFEVEVSPQSTAADFVHVTGNVSLGGGVAHIGENGNYGLRSVYTILETDGTLSGRFDSVQSDFAFLTPDLNYDYGAGKVQLGLQRNDIAFASHAATANQRATAIAIESIGVGAGHAVYDAVAQLSNNRLGIQQGFSALSGEIHASTKTALLDDSRFIRDAATNRLRTAFGTAGTATWLQQFGNWGHSDTNGNTHKLKRSTNGFMLGADTPVSENWRVGAMAGYSHTKADARDVSSSNKSDNYHVGIYGGGQWNALGLRLGAAHSWHNMRTKRSVRMQGLSEELNASPKARTTQLFADVAYNVDAGVVQLEPFANLAYVNLHNQSFSENGGAAALKSSSQNTDMTFMTLGSRLSGQIGVGQTQVTLSASAGWRHTFGRVSPKASQRFSQGEAFSITGVPLSRNSVVLEAGAGMMLSRSVSVGMSYHGQLGSDAKDHSIRANVGIAF